MLSHRSAAALWGMRPPDVLEVTVPAYRAVRAITVHTSPLPPDEVTSVNAIPVTGVSRTLLDLAAVLRPHQVERAVNEAEVQQLTDPLSLADLIARHPRRKGIKAILETGPASPAASSRRGSWPSRARAGLPPPSLNARLLGLEISRGRAARYCFRVDPKTAALLEIAP